MPTFIDPDRFVLAMQERDVRFSGFMERLPPDDLFTFFQLLATINSGGDSVSAFMLGQVAAILRTQHGICLHCGEKHSIEAHLEAAAGQVPTPTSKKEEMRIPPQFAKALKAMNVHLDENSDLHGIDIKELPVICNECETEYDDIAARASHGIACPVCAS